MMNSFIINDTQKNNLYAYVHLISLSQTKIYREMNLNLLISFPLAARYKLLSNSARIATGLDLILFSDRYKVQGILEYKIELFCRKKSS